MEIPRLFPNGTSFRQQAVRVAPNHEGNAFGCGGSRVADTSASYRPSLGGVHIRRDVCILTTPFFLFLQTPRNLPFFPFRFGPTLVHTSYVHCHSLPPSLPDACQPFPSSLRSLLVVRRRVTSPQIFILSREEGGRKGNTSRERDPEALAC